MVAKKPAAKKKGLKVSKSTVNDLSVKGSTAKKVKAGGKRPSCIDPTGFVG